MNEKDEKRLRDTRDKRLRDTRDCLVALLTDMLDEPPGPVTLSELDGFSKAGLLTTCCAEMIVMSLRATSPNLELALSGLELLVGDMRKMLEHPPLH